VGPEVEADARVGEGEEALGLEVGGLPAVVEHHRGGPLEHREERRGLTRCAHADDDDVPAVYRAFHGSGHYTRGRGKAKFRGKEPRTERTSRGAGRATR
jgi:hypothetical protein